MILKQTRGKIVVLFYTNTRNNVLLSVEGKIIPMPNFSQSRPTLKKADYLLHEPDYLNHAQEIIFQFLVENKAIFNKGRLTNQFCYRKRFF